MSRDVMKAVKQVKEKTDGKRNCLEARADDINLLIKNSNGSWELSYNSFLFGFGQGMKFAKKEGRQ